MSIWPKVMEETNMIIYGLRDWMYFLADSIYLCWPIFIKSCTLPSLQAELKFTKWQEHAREDIKHCFDVLVAKHRVLEHILFGLFLPNIKTLVNFCIILICKCT